MEVPYSCDVGAASSKAAGRDAPASKPKRRPGRPRRADAPVVDWAAVDRLLVFGERHVDPATGQQTVKYPTLAAIAERYDVSRNLIWVYSNKSKCYARREEARVQPLTRTDEKPSASMPRVKRRTGRPRQADAALIDWATVDRLLVFGERQVNPVTGQAAVTYPSLATLGERYNVSANRMWLYANKSRCFERRNEAREKTLARTDEKLIEKLSEVRALATSDVVGVADQFLLRFETELREGRVKTDSAVDFDRVARLRELMLGRSDSRSELNGELSLSAIQERHRRLRSRVDELTPEVTGTADHTPRELAGVRDAGCSELAGDEHGGEDLR